MLQGHEGRENIVALQFCQIRVQVSCQSFSASARSKSSIHVRGLACPWHHIRRPAYAPQRYCTAQHSPCVHIATPSRHQLCCRWSCIIIRREGNRSVRILVRTLARSVQMRRSHVPPLRYTARMHNAAQTPNAITSSDFDYLYSRN